MSDGFRISQSESAFLPLRFLCLSHPFPGHLDWGGYLATAAALARRGHEVLWASGPEVAASVVAAGVRFVAVASTGWHGHLPPLPPDLGAEEREQVRRARGLAVWLQTEAVGPALAAFSAVADGFRPDAVLIEPFVAAGALLAERAGLPLVVIGRPALPPAAVPGPPAAVPGPPAAIRGPAAEAIARLREMAGVAGDYWDRARGTPSSPHLHLDFFCRGWYADLTAVGEQTVFCGGSALASPAPESAPPLVLITLGSTFNHDDAFFRIAAGAVIQAGAQPWLVLGRGGARPAGLPEGVRVSEWVEYGAVFPRLAAIIHHGGVGTTHAALVHGLPQIVVPHAGDQLPQAGRVTQAGVGYGVRPADFDLARAPVLVSQLLGDPSFCTSAEWWAAEIAGLGGAEHAAQAIELVVVRG